MILSDKKQGVYAFDNTLQEKEFAQKLDFSRTQKNKNAVKWFIYFNNFLEVKRSQSKSRNEFKNLNWLIANDEMRSCRFCLYTDFTILLAIFEPFMCVGVFLEHIEHPSLART